MLQYIHIQHTHTHYYTQHTASNTYNSNTQQHSEQVTHPTATHTQHTRNTHATHRNKTLHSSITSIGVTFPSSIRARNKAENILQFVCDEKCYCENVKLILDHSLPFSLSLSSSRVSYHLINH